MDEAPKPKKTRRVAASQSFVPDEVQLLDFVFNSLLMSSNPQAATRHKSFPSMLRKISAMKNRVATVRAGRPQNGTTAVQTNGAGVEATS